MAKDPRLEGQIRSLEESHRAMEKIVVQVKERIRTMEKHLDAAKMVSPAEVAKVKSEISTARRDLDRKVADVKTMERSLNDLKRLRK